MNSGVHQVRTMTPLEVVSVGGGAGVPGRVATGAGVDGCVTGRTAGAPAAGSGAAAGELLQPVSALRPSHARHRMKIAERTVRSAPKLPVSYTHLRAHETRHDLVCRLLLEK